MLVLMRSYFLVKLALLGVFLLVFAVSLLANKVHLNIHPRIVWFYFSTAIIGLVWSFIGLLNPTHYREGVFASLKLYVLWSAAFCLLWVLFRSMPSLRVFHTSFIIAGLAIPAVNLLALYGSISGHQFVPSAIQDELAIEYGFGHGYFQASSNNVISMFLVAPYLLAMQFRKDAPNSLVVKLSLFASLAFAATSGRRALWLVIALIPCLVALLSWLTATPIKFRRLALAYSAAALIALAVLLAVPMETDTAAISGVQRALSSEDMRSQQGDYLFAAFLKSPLLGTGFGAHVYGYLGNDDWQSTYELTYLQMLLNLGLLGTALVAALFISYFRRVIVLLKGTDSAVPFCLLVAFLGLVLGASTNPYLGGFDSLCFIGLLPFLSTFKQGLSLRAANHVERPSRSRRMRYGDLIRCLGRDEDGSNPASRA